MRKRDFIIFFSIVLSVHSLINFYIFIRGHEAIMHKPMLRTIFIGVFVFLSLSYIAGRFLERVSLSWFSSTMVWIGSFWLGAMVYFLLMILAVDVLRLANSLISFFPDFITSDYQRAKEVTAIIASVSVVIIVIAGYMNARIPRIKTLNLEISKNSHAMKELSIVAVSDIHLGTIICKSRLQRIVKKMNALDPDLVLLPGDVVDEDLAPVIKQNLGETLRTIKSRYGVIAVTGNHEYIGGAEAAVRYLTEHGITVLRDAAMKVNGSMYIVGREDLSANRFGGWQRKSLQEILNGVDKSFPIILMDHQPFGLHEAENNGIDLQFSGHTHHGQLWPFNYITRKIYEVSWGYKKKGDTHVYVSCGVGTWGPPLRLGNTPEIVNMKLRFV